MKQLLIVMSVLLASVLLHAQHVPQGLLVGDRAPAFKVNDHTGKQVYLKKMLRRGPVVLLFYRGQWCPFCNKQLSALSDSLSLLTAQKAQVIAVTPETAANVGKTVASTNAAFPIISDSGMAIMNAYKVTFAVDEKTVEKYKTYGIDLDAANGSNGKNLPVPAVYIISRKGIVVYRHFDPNYTQRPAVKDLLAQLAAAQ